MRKAQSWQQKTDQLWYLSTLTEQAQGKRWIPERANQRFFLLCTLRRLPTVDHLQHRFSLTVLEEWRTVETTLNPEDELSWHGKKRSFAGGGFSMPGKTSLTLRNIQMWQRYPDRKQAQTSESLNFLQPGLLSITATSVQHFSVLILTKRQDMSTWWREKGTKKPLHIPARHVTLLSHMFEKQPTWISNKYTAFLPFSRKLSLKIRPNLFFFGFFCITNLFISFHLSSLAVL